MNSYVASESQGQSPAFFLLYVSLILIVLTVFIGTLYRPDKKDSPLKYETDMRPLEDKTPDPIGTLEYKDLFETDGYTPREATLSALVSLLQSHDVTVRIDVYPSVDSEAGLAEALGKSVSLQRFFLAKKFPPHYVSVFAHAQSRDVQAQIQVIPEGESP